mgnify:CR=1 FL=1
MAKTKFYGTGKRKSKTLVKSIAKFMKVYYYRIALNLSRKYRKFDYMDCNLI